MLFRISICSIWRKFFDFAALPNMIISGLNIIHLRFKTKADSVRTRVRTFFPTSLCALDMFQRETLSAPQCAATAFVVFYVSHQNESWSGKLFNKRIFDLIIFPAFLLRKILPTLIPEQHQGGLKAEQTIWRGSGGCGLAHSKSGLWGVRVCAHPDYRQS